MKPLSAWGLEEPIIILAPMEGVVDAVLRDLVSAEGGVDLCVTEFIRVTHTLLPDKVFLTMCPELRTGSRTRSGTPVLVQLLGGDPTCLADNASVAISLGAHGIDLNFGCPAKKVNNHDGGASLLRAPERLFQIVAAVRKAVPAHQSVSAKVRLGYDHKDHVVEIAQAAAAGGASWLTVHARTKMEGYRPPAHWEFIARMKDAVDIPVIANGDIWTVDDFHVCRAISGCENVMIGRGLIANPGLAQQIKTRAVGKKPWPEWQNFFQTFARASSVFRSPNYAVQRTKQLSKMMGQTYGEGLLLLEKIKRLNSLEDVETILQNHWPSLSAPPAPRLIQPHSAGLAGAGQELAHTPVGLAGINELKVMINRIHR